MTEFRSRNGFKKSLTFRRRGITRIRCVSKLTACDRNSGGPRSDQAFTLADNNVH